MTNPCDQMIEKYRKALEVGINGELTSEFFESLRKDPFKMEAKKMRVVAVNINQGLQALRTKCFEPLDETRKSEIRKEMVDVVEDILRHYFPYVMARLLRSSCRNS